jgi:FkbM family methyltransferase
VEVQRSLGVKPDVKARFNRLLRRPTEADFAALAAFRPAHGTVSVDAGANRGETIASVRLYLPDIPIVAFEPNPVLVDLIRARHRSDPALTLHPVGLSDAVGRFELYVPYYKGVPFDGLASFSREEAASWLSAERLAGFDARHQEIRTFDCEVSKLDAFSLAPSFVKIDVQGLEAAVIAGGAETIARHKPVILMENNDPQRDSRQLAEMGYRYFAFDAGRMHAKRWGSLNTFYIHPETAGLFDAAVFA